MEETMPALVCRSFNWLVLCVAALLAGACASAQGSLSLPPLPPDSTNNNVITGTSRLILPTNLMEDKSRLTYDASAVQGVLRAAIKAEYNIGLLHNKSIVQKAAEEANQNLRNVVLELLEYYAEVQKYPETILIVGSSTVGLASRQAPVYTSSLLLSSNSLGLDLAYQRTYGDRQTVGGITVTPDGDSIAFRLDFTHGPITSNMPQESDVRDFSAHQRESFRKVFKDAAGPLIDYVNSPASDHNKPNDTAVDNLCAPIKSILDIAEANSAEFDAFAHAYRRRVGGFRAAALGAYTSFANLGTITHFGLSLSQLFPLGRAAKDNHVGSALLLAANLEGVWYQPSASLRQNGFTSQKDVRLVTAFAWQDRFPHFVEGTFDKKARLIYGYVKKWTQQYGVEYSRANDVDGGDYFGLYGRWRTDRVEYRASVGSAAHDGTSARFGINYFFY
jgi:hypothetical protein